MSPRKRCLSPKAEILPQSPYEQITFMLLTTEIDASETTSEKKMTIEYTLKPQQP